MTKKCVICSKEATYCIKGSSSDCYCEPCAIDHFGDVTYLIKVDDIAKQLKHQIDQLTEEGIKPHSDEEMEPVDQLAEEGIELDDDE